MNHYFHANYFYRQFPNGKLSSKRQLFYDLVHRYEIDFIQSPLDRERTYSLKDWNAKVPTHYRVSPYVI